MSINLNKRHYAHKHYLSKGKHENEMLQRAYDKHKNYHWEVIEYTEENLPDKEKHYISAYDSYQNGYNLTEGGENPPIHYGPMSQTQKDNISKGQPKGGDHWTRKNGWSKESLAKRSKSQTGWGNGSFSGITDEYLMWLTSLGMGCRKIEDITGMTRQTIRSRIKKLGENK